MIEYLLLILGLIISLSAQVFVTSSYAKYKKIPNKKELSGFEVARKILDEHGLNNVYITEVSGTLSDHYDPSRKVVRLSKDIFHGTTIAAASVAAHEVGHAIQDKENYTFMKIRSMLVPFVNFSSYAGYFAILIGLLFGAIEIFWLGILLEIVILIFQLVTLPVEIDASRRALVELKKYKLLEKSEVEESKKMLTAAASTYVASIVTVILEILRLILIMGNTDDRH